MPFLISSRGFFCDDSWTSVSDIGKSSGEVVFNAEDYLRFERLVISFFSYFIYTFGGGVFVVSDVEGGQEDVESAKKLALRIGLDRIILSALSPDGGYSISDLPDLIRLALREHLWFRIKSPGGVGINFGYDMCVYLTGGVDVNEVEAVANDFLLPVCFVDKSPYEYIEK